MAQDNYEENPPPNKPIPNSIEQVEGTKLAVTMEVLPENTVLIAGGGPVGLLLAHVLSHYNVKTVLLERNHTTTK